MTMKTVNNTRAISAAVPAREKNPRTPAINPTIRNQNAQCNILNSFPTSLEVLVSKMRAAKIYVREIF